MIVGIYIGNTAPEIGGGHTLISTIIDEILHKEISKECVFIYSGDGKQREVIKNGLRFADLTWYKRRYGIHIGIRNMIQSLSCIFRLNRPTHAKENYIEELTDYYDISFLWIAVPAIIYSSRPYAFTVWDLGHRVLPEMPEMSVPINEWYNRERLYQTMLGRATYVITGNDTGKKEIVENYHISPEKIVTITFPITSFCVQEEKKPRINLDDDFFFYPAQFWSHKNHICILNALNILKKDHGIRIQVVFTGSDKGNMSYIKSRCHELGLDEQIVFSGFLEYEEIKYLYLHAKAMIFASLLGPNNLPLYEAIYLGCPVLCSDLDGHKEQMGNAALFFDGKNPDSLAELIRNYLSDSSLKERLIPEMAVKRHVMEDYKYSDRMEEVIMDFKKRRETWSND